MRLETFFEKFELFADAPNAVVMMRELVLELAVRGQLVEQNSTEMPALESLRGSSRAVRALTVNGDLTVPAGWASVPLGCAIASNTGGGTPSKQNPAYWNGSIPWASVKDIQSDKFLTTTLDSITEEGLRNSSSNLIPPNRLLVVTRMGLGKLAINKIPVAINQDLRAIEPNEALDLDFAYLLFKALKLVGKGVTVKGVTLDELHSMPVALPPLAEQKRIVAKVDELMALCDRLEVQQQERDTRHAALARASLARFAEAPTPANLDFLFHQSYSITPADLRKSILSLAVHGKLVPQDPNDAPAANLLVQIVEEQTRMIRERTIRRQEISPVSEDEELFDIPDGWVWTRLGQIGDWGSGSTPSRGAHELYGGGITWLKSGELNDNRQLMGSDESVTELALKTGSFRRNQPGDVLIAMYGATIGKLAILAEPAVTNQAVCGCTPFSGVVNTYLFLYLFSQREQFHSASEGGAQPNISKVKIVNTLFPLPPHTEQRRIVAKVDQLMALVDQLETQLTVSRATAGKLMEAVVSELVRNGEGHEHEQEVERRVTQGTKVIAA